MMRHRTLMKSRLVRSIGVHGGCAAICTLVFCASCGGGSVEVPEPSLAQSLDAQRSFDPIRQMWNVSTPEARVSLAPRLRTFRARFPTDPLARVADAYLAFIALEQKQNAYAKTLASSLENVPQGNTRDLRTVVMGAVLARENRPEEALSLLDPLVGKMLDPFARDLLLETVVLAATQARKWYQAVVYMNEWFYSANEQATASLQKKLTDTLKTFPPDEMESIWNTLISSEHRDIWQRPLKQLLAIRVAEIATQRGDPHLARSVLESSRSVITQSPEGVALAQLATSGGRSARVIDARVGWLIDTRTTTATSRSSQAASGALQVFDPAESNRGANATGTWQKPVLVSQSFGTGEKQSDAIEELVIQGASIIVGGYDSVSAKQLSAYGEANSIAVMTLVHPGKLPDDARFTFVLGTKDASLHSDPPGPACAQVNLDRDLCIAELGPEPSAQAPSQPNYVACPSGDSLHKFEPFPAATWRKNKVKAIAVDGTEACARMLLRDIFAARFTPQLYLGLQARQALTGPVGSHVHVATCGHLDAPSDTQPPSMHAWVQATGRSPTWFEAIGRDAARLAYDAVSPLPSQTTMDPKQVMGLRAVVQQKLATEQTDLWTTKQTGFDKSNIILRNIYFIRAKQ